MICRHARTAAAELPAPAGAADFCGTHADRDWLFPLGRPALAPAPDRTGPTPCRVLEMAIDTDWEFTGNLFGGDTRPCV